MATITERYRSVQLAQAERVRSTVNRIYDDAIDPDDIAESATRASARLAPQLAGEQRVAQGLARGFVRGTSVAELGEAVDPLPALDIAGTTRAGMSLRDGMAAIGPMILDQVGKGSPIDKAIEFGRFAFERFGTNEVTGAADREQEHQETRPEITGWEGIVSANACDACQDNAGVHDLDDEMWRHGNCTCTRVPVWGGGG
jgi:hypothetical protein